MASEGVLAAARKLHEKLGYQSWLTTVGVGMEDGHECLYVYASQVGARERSSIPSEWKGYPVVIKKLGGIRPGVTTWRG